jgi:hypothetical protein
MYNAPMNAPRGGVVVCGLGPNPPATASLEALHALAGCDVVLYRGPDAACLQTLRHFDVCPRLESVSGGPAALRKRAEREARAGHRVGVVSRGHPLGAGGWAAELARARAAAGEPCESPAAVGEMDCALAALGRTLGIDAPGLRCYEAAALASARGLDRKLPLVVALPADERPDRRALRAKLVAVFGAGHPCAVFGPRAQDRPRRARLGALDREALPSGGFLYVPEEREAEHGF